MMQVWHDANHGLVWALALVFALAARLFASFPWAVGFGVGMALAIYAALLYLYREDSHRIDTGRYGPRPIYIWAGPSDWHWWWGSRVAEDEREWRKRGKI